MLELTNFMMVKRHEGKNDGNFFSIHLSLCTSLFSRCMIELFCCLDTVDHDVDVNLSVACILHLEIISI